MALSSWLASPLDPENRQDSLKRGRESRGVQPTVAELLEKRCPCYDRMYGIFGGKANVTPLAQFDSGVGASLYEDPSDPAGALDPALSPEVFYAGWDESQLDQPHSGLTTPAAQLDLTRCLLTLNRRTSLELPDLDNADIHHNDDEDLPPPLNLSGVELLLGGIELERDECFIGLPL
ncbi:hypothetical protein PGTUg99_012120 [Puccinia graminis f. sp. tritici]|uniref:Uncharacterized protein n=1 Tax=Puccinia graminis f. sp. tritici TaxID=56615 RepID=A0A5B0S9Z4_PUCGR|nr:hypothetical protein PGTUg99_012120 [Puccinia graminis f. sp. tritici]